MFCRSIETNTQGFFGPRHLDFHPTKPWVFVSIERQNKLYVYELDATTGLKREPMFVKDTLANPKRALRVLPGALYELGVAVTVALSVAPQLVDSTQRVRRARRVQPDRPARMGATA